jgi:hypothetical protein
MDIPPIDDTPTPIPEPDNQVEADLTFPGIHLIDFIIYLQELPEKYYRSFQIIKKE